MKTIRELLKYNLPAYCLSDIRFYFSSKALSAVEEKKCVNECVSSHENKSIYYFENNLRKVYPFYYQYSTFCKRKWIKQKIIDVFCGEFTSLPREEVATRLSNSLIKVNDKTVNPDYVMKESDLISSVIHRHELAVLSCPIEIIFENDDLLVVDKPPSIPMHPGGLYFNNTMVNILANEYSRTNLYVLHRLDRLTSGVLLFAKSKEKSVEIHREINLCNVKKEYVCRVKGNFPEDVIVCNKPIKHIYRKIGTCIVQADGKASVTEFKKLSFNGKSSVVLCKPLTGRMHQIRVHLQFLGYPIINDPIYNSFVFGPLKGKNGFFGKSVSQLIYDINKEHSQLFVSHKNACENKYDYLKFSIFKNYYSTNNELKHHKKDNSKIIKDKNCLYCKNGSQDPVQWYLGMFLHAWRYKTDDWVFESKLPFWAFEEWNVA